MWTYDGENDICRNLFFPLVVRLNKMIMAYEENQRYIQNSGGKISLIRHFERREYKNI
jgi:hypothetical protein